MRERLPHLRFDAHDLTALPAAICRSAEPILATAPDDVDPTGTEPNW